MPGGDPEKYQVTPDDLEEAFKAEMNIIKEKRAKVFQAQETEKQENLKKKLEIIDKIKALATSPDEANRSYQQFKDLQQQWREIKAVPAEKANELWRNYQLYVEQFYDLLKLNNEAREYDRVRGSSCHMAWWQHEKCHSIQGRSGSHIAEREHRGFERAR